MKPNLAHWKDRAFLTHAETAAIFGCSLLWVRGRILTGELTESEVAGSHQTMIPVSSVIALVERLTPPASPRPPYSRPTLAWSSPNA